MIEDLYRARTPGSAALYAQACRALPAGLTHDSRAISPYPIYVARAAGARKWDVDGNEYVDYFGGHGALLFGHSHPPLVEAVQRQAALGTHWGASHELEVRWPELVQRLVPSAARVRFTGSGTEASQLALRLARAYTGKTRIMRFVGHFHGWHDAVAPGGMSHYDGSVPAGIPESLVRETLLLPADDAGPVLDLLQARNDIAAVIVEPSGASWGQVPLPSGFLAAQREKIGHQGTFNANPLCAAAGVAALSLVEAGDACARAEAAAGELRAGLRRILVEEGVPWGIFGEASVFVIFPNPTRLPLDPANFDPLKLGFKGLKGARDPQLNNRLRVALLAHGVDIAGGPGGFVSAAHGGRELSQTLDAFRGALRALKAAGSL